MAAAASPPGTGTSAPLRPVPLESLVGTWRRTLQTRLFSTLAVGSDDVCTVCIDVAPTEIRGVSAAAGGTPPPRYRWSFGKSVEAARVGYVVEVLSDVPSSSESLPLRVSHAGRDYYGMYQADLGCLTMHITGSRNVTIVYRVLDDDTMAVCIVEVPTRGTPVIQNGFMFRER